MKRISLIGLMALFGGMMPAVASAAITSDFHITPSGAITITNVIVMQKAGSDDLFCRANVGNTFIRVTVLAHDATVITKNHGEKTTSDMIAAGDLINVDGTLTAGDDSISMDAAHIRILSANQETKTLSGSISSVDPSGASFVLTNKTFGTTIVALSATTTIVKGARAITASDLAAGDKVLAVTGTYDYTTNTLAAAALSVYQSPSVFVPRNFQGTLVSMSGTTLPTSFVVAVDGTNYTVFLDQNVAVMNKTKAQTSLGRFQPGDTVRFYGAVRKMDLTQVDAEVVRDLNF